eukprot:superscaffoldBa00009159_g23902
MSTPGCGGRVERVGREDDRLLFIVRLTAVCSRSAVTSEELLAVGVFSPLAKVSTVTAENNKTYQTLRYHKIQLLYLSVRLTLS